MHVSAALVLAFALAVVNVSTAADLDKKTAKQVEALIADLNADPGVQKGEFPQALGENVEGELGAREDAVIWVEGDAGSRFIRRADLFEGAYRFAAGILLAPDAAIPTNLELEAVGECIHDRDPDAVEATGHLVAALAELSAGMQRGHDDLSRGSLLDGVFVRRNPATVIDHSDAVVRVNDDRDLRAEARQRLVNRVVDDFVDKMMQPSGPGGPNVHRGALAHRFEAFQDLNGAGVVSHS